MKHTRRSPPHSFTWTLRLNSRDAMKLKNSQLEMMRAVVRPWVEIRDITSTEGLGGQIVFLLSAHTLGSLTTGYLSHYIITIDLI